MRSMRPAPKSLQLAIRCDGLRDRGVGHLIRQMALIEELRERGHHVRLVGDIDVEWAGRQAADLADEIHPGMPDPDFIAACGNWGTDVVMIDGYFFDSGLGSGLQTAGISVITMVDDRFGRDQVADTYVDQNFGALPGATSANWLIGPDYVLLRDVVRNRRGHYRVEEPARPRVLVVFGGTDPFGGSPVAAELLLATGEAVEVVAVAANPETAERLRRLELRDGQELEVLPPQDDLPGLALTCHFAVSAAGSSVWEFACLGIPTALVCVVDNQLEGYRNASHELAVGLGLLSELRSDDDARQAAVTELSRLMTDTDQRRRYSERSRRIVDGDGRVRVADEIERLAR